MKISHGLLDGQVLQRDNADRGGAVVRGTSKTEGVVWARVASAKGVVRGLDWREVGQATGRNFEATLKGIPSGGPYTIEFVIGEDQETMTVADIYVGDVWFLAGQSNMQGVGNTADAPKPHPLVRAFVMRDEWELAEEPLHMLQEAVDVVHNGGDRLTPAKGAKAKREAVKGVGPGLYFGREMVARTKVPQGLIICAHGGTSMAQWSPELKDQGGASLYGAMIRRFEKLGQPARGVLWYQGESDAYAEAAKIYTEKMQELVAATRADFGQPNLPWCVVQIGRVVSSTWDGGYWNSIQDQQRLLPETIDNLDVVPTIDLGLDDSIHISGADNEPLGIRLARLADRLALGNRKEKGSIRFRDIKTYTPTGATDPAQNALEITFDNVVGGLTSAGRPAGFSVLDPEGNVMPMMYKTRLEGNKVILESTVASAALEAFSLAYGHGLDPYCNITDARGMGIPVIGAQAIAGSGGSPFLTNWSMRRVDLAGGLKKANAPERGSLRGRWAVPFSSTAYLVMPQDTKAAQPGHFYLRTAVIANDPIDLELAFGADSPFKIWLNGEEVGADLSATNPCTADEYRFPVSLFAGNNDLIVAFDGRKGQGWGICARFLPVEGEELPEGVLEI